MSMIQPMLNAAISRRRLLGGATAAGISALALAVRNANAAGTANYPGAIKLVSVCRKRADLTDEAFYDYWTYRHGPYASEQIRTLGGYRYVQNHTGFPSLTGDLRAARGQAARAFEGITEVWFPSAQALTDRTTTAEGLLANANLARDEHNFIDTVNSTYFFTYEHVLLGSRAIGRLKLIDNNLERL